ncbi:MAG TPA: tetratricopeptide repeat protein [Methylomirabilota bacterium]|jgi:Flp pilus assembly protein TadD|nr:tetratricopeptide repeat protein [Methylomirabilota bacterium]
MFGEAAQAHDPRLTCQHDETWPSRVRRDEGRLYSRMAESSPTAAVPHVNLAFVRLPRGEIASANEHLREAVRLAPGSPRAQTGLGLTETLLGHLDVGLRHGLRARELAPDSADVLASLGALYLARGEPARAVPELSASLRVKPNQVHAALNLALAWLDQPEAAEASSSARWCSCGLSVRACPSRIALPRRSRRAETPRAHAPPERDTSRGCRREVT